MKDLIVDVKLWGQLVGSLVWVRQREGQSQRLS